jgi:N-acetylneuraminic acid mutarotase
MSNDFYNASGFPVTGTQASSAAMRAELALITAGFEKMPQLAGNAGKMVVVAANGDELAVLAVPEGALVGGTAEQTLQNKTLGTGSTWNGNAITVTYGGTGATTAAGARTNLGLVIGTDVQAFDADLQAIAALPGTTGLLRKTGANTWELDTTAYEPAITSGTAAQYQRGDKTWANFAADVRAAALTGLSTATGTSITATDTVLSALGKLQKQISDVPAGGTGTGTGTGTGGTTAPARYFPTETASPFNSTPVRAMCSMADGRVFVHSGLINGAAIYKALGGKWTYQLALVPRTGIGKATKLSDDRVLVFDATSFLDNTNPRSYIFDPATRGFTGAQEMPYAVARVRYATAALNDGRVFVCGGQSTTSALSFAHIYNPTSNTWTAVASMPAARFQHAAVTLDDGKVFVCGGKDFANTLYSTAHTYNPATNAWTAVASMPTPKFGQQAARLADGRVLLCGGYKTNPSNTQTVNDLAEVDIYNPTTNTWTTAAAMPKALTDHAATTLADGKILVCGGQDNEDDPQSSTYIYNPTSNTWTAVASMPNGKDAHSIITLDNGSVLAINGNDNSNLNRLLYLYNPTTNIWNTITEATTEPNSRWGFSCTELQDNRIIFLGGVENNIRLSNAAIYNPTTNAWTAVAPMPTAKSKHAAVTLDDGTVFVCGGDTGASPSAETNEAHIYSPTSDTWTAVASMPGTRSRHAAAKLSDGKVFVCGGFQTASSATNVWIYNPTTDSWTNVASSIPLALSDHAAVGLADGRVLVCAPGVGLIYNPTLNTWTEIAGDGSDGNVFAAALSAGKILVARNSTVAISSAFPQRFAVYHPTI